MNDRLLEGLEELDDDDRPVDAGAGNVFMLLSKVIAALALLAIVAITTIDVLGRYVLNSPLQGSYQITSTLLAVMTFAGLLIVTVEERHLKAGIMEGLLRGRFANWWREVVWLLTLASFVVIAWRCALMSMQWQQSGEKLGHTYGIPLYLLGYHMTILSALTAIVMVCRRIAARRKP